MIFLFMYGGPSHIDTFDYKPKLFELDGKTIEVKTFGRGGHKNQGRVVGPISFKQYGQCGKWVSSLFPHMAQCVDDISFLHAMYADSPIHGSALLMMNSGRILSGHPCLGSWINYGLGSENENLPGFVVMLDKTGGPISGPKNWSSGYMPAAYQATVVRADHTPIHDLSLPPAFASQPAPPPRSLVRQKQRASGQRARQLGAERSHRQLRVGVQDATVRPRSCRFQPGNRQTQELYGLDHPQTQDFGRKCLLARRLVERGVRFIQVYSGGDHNDDNWDAHTDIVANHTKHAGHTDKPVAALLKDLKRRGLLDSTLVIWGGEFGRQPTAEYAKGTGRDHNAYGFTMWMAGGGIKPGISVGTTDELGSSRRDRPLPRQEPARHHPATDGPRSQ